MAKEVDVDRPWPVAFRSNPAQTSLDLQKTFQERKRRQPGEHSADEIVEIRLFDPADRLRPVDGGNAIDRRDPRDRAKGGGQARRWIVEVGAQAENDGTQTIPRMSASTGGTTWFTFDTTHHALWAEEVASEARIPTEVVPAPAGAHARCNLALVTVEDEIERLVTTLDGAGVPFALFTAGTASAADGN